MKILRNELAEFKALLSTNVNADWSENDPSQEFSSLAEQLQIIIDKSIPDERQEACERLSHLICDDEDRYDSMDSALKLLEEQSEIDGSVMADDIVMMWQKVEWSFTVDELLEEIGL
jgi:hypothetical protein